MFLLFGSSLDVTYGRKVSAMMPYGLSSGIRAQAVYTTKSTQYTGLRRCSSSGVVGSIVSNIADPIFALALTGLIDYSILYSQDAYDDGTV